MSSDPGEQEALQVGSDALAKRARAGDREAFEELVRRYRPVVAEQVRTVLAAAPMEEQEELARRIFDACRRRLHEPVPFAQLVLREATRLARRRRRSGSRLWLAALSLALAVAAGAALLLLRQPRKEPAPAVETKPVDRASPATASVAPAREPLLAPDAGPTRRTRRRRAGPARVAAPAAAASTDAGASPDIRPRKVVVLPGKVKGDDHIITVAPAAKIKPLFDAEEYKRRGLRRILGGREPVKPAPEGIEDEVD